jgi:rod shape-determining protein MreC
MSLSRPMAWTLSLVLLAAAGLGMARTGMASPFQSFFGRVFTPVEGGVHALTQPVADFIANAGNIGRIKQENQDLRAENERLKTQVTQMQEAQAEATQTADLQSAAQLFPNADFLDASVIAHGSDNIHDTVELDKGSSDGLQTGMIVMGKGGALIGVVYKTMSTASWVRLITDPDSDVNGVVLETRAMGTVSGALNQRLQLQFVQENTDVQAGDTVITSGLGGNFPKGLLIGRVSKVAGGQNDLFKTIAIDPAIRPDTLEEVLVMTSFLPARGVTAAP